VNEADKENWDQATEVPGVHTILQTLESSADDGELVVTNRWNHVINGTSYSHKRALTSFTCLSPCIFINQ
jgi:hypothetical protein